MKLSVSAILFVTGCVIVGAFPQQASSSDMKNDDVKEESSSKVQMVEKALYSDKDCKDVIIRQFYQVDDGIGCSIYSNGQCGSNGEIGSHMYKCPTQEAELDLKEYVRLDVYSTENCSGSVSTTSYFPRKNQGKCTAYDKLGKNTESQIFKIDGETLSVGWISCDKLEVYTNGKCVDGAIAHF